MLTSLEGIVRDGKVELLEIPAQAEGSRVVVTFLPERGPVNLKERGINQSEAANLRARLCCFIEDWNHPDMDIYDEV